ncbi:hypothetical protein [Metapseudomonas lalkuanensis]|nr:hypothetical protein [Pseudomonas lalkuanensis]
MRTLSGMSGGTELAIGFPAGANSFVKQAEGLPVGVKGNRE